MKRCINCGSNITNQSGVCRRCLIKQPDWYQDLDEESRKKINKNKNRQLSWNGLGISFVYAGVLCIIFGADILICIALIIIGLAIFAFL